jgi:hypothetical protein
MKAGIICGRGGEKILTTTPWNNPTLAPKINVTIIAITILSVTGIHVTFLMINAKIIETADAIEPTDRSIPPEIKTIDSPIARTLKPKNHVSNTCQFEGSQNLGLIKPVISDIITIARTILNIGTLPLTISSNLILKA